MKKQERIEQARRALETLARAPAPNPMREASARRAFLEQAARLRGSARPARVGTGRRLTGWVRFGAASAFAVLALGALTGVAAASDRSRPGDMLYPLDRSIETLRLAAAHDPAGKVDLLLEFAAERLQEAEQLASAGQEQQMNVALEAYDQTVADLEAAVGAAGEAGLVETLDQALSVHEQRLQTIRQQAPEQAWPGLDRAIEASQKGRGGGSSQGHPEKTPGPPADKPGGPSNPHPERTPGPPEDRPNHPEKTHGPP